MTEPLKWFDFAREDLIAAETMLEKELYNLACFHSQQGIEKGLKGFLRSRGQDFRKTHALVELAEMCRILDESFSALDKTCRKLDSYYIPTRYPDALPGGSREGLPTDRDAEKAVELLQRTLAWIRKKMAQE